MYRKEKVELGMPPLKASKWGWLSELWESTKVLNISHFAMCLTLKLGRWKQEDASSLPQMTAGDHSSLTNWRERCAIPLHFYDKFPSLALMCRTKRPRTFKMKGSYLISCSKATSLITKSYSMAKKGCMDPWQPCGYLRKSIHWNSQRWRRKKSKIVDSRLWGGCDNCAARPSGSLPIWNQRELNQPQFITVENSKRREEWWFSS